MENINKSKLTEMLKTISPENQIFFKNIAQGLLKEKNIVNKEALNKKKCLMCQLPSNKKCDKCNTVFFCSKDCEKKSKKLHKTVCIINRGLPTMETKMTSFSISYDEDIQNKSVCYVCESDKNLKIYDSSVFCENCLMKK